MLDTNKKSDEQWNAEAAREERLKRLAEMKTGDGNKRKVKKGVSLLSVVAIVLILAIIGSIFIWSKYNDGYPETHNVALTIDGRKITPNELNYFVGNVGGQFFNSGVFHPENAAQLKTAFGEDKIVRDYVVDQAINLIRDNEALLQYAKENKVTLDAEQKTIIKNFFVQMSNVAAQRQMSVKDFMAVLYGKGASESTLTPILENVLLATKAGEMLQKSFKYTDAQLDEAYNKDKDNYDAVEFRSYSFPNGKNVNFRLTNPAGEATKPSETEKELSPEEKAAIEEKAQKEAMDKAKAFLDKVKDDATFNKEALELTEADQKEAYEKNDSSLIKGAKKASVDKELAAWLFDSARKAGDKTVIETGSGATVVYFVKRERPELKTYSVRHILFSANAGSKPEEKAAAKAKAEEIKKEFEAGDKTSESFGKLADTHTGDGGSKGKGGLYENVTPGSMVKPFEDFCLDSSRKAGDVGIVETDFGYHLIYFVGSGNSVWKNEVEAALRTADYEKFMQEATEKQKFEKADSGMKYVLPIK